MTEQQMQEEFMSDFRKLLKKYNAVFEVGYTWTGETKPYAVVEIVYDNDKAFQFELPEIVGTSPIYSQITDNVVV
jgi:hypothetical protein